MSEAALRRLWHHRHWGARLLWPLSLLYGLLARGRQILYHWRWLPTQHPGVPVIVVGNVIAGGAGKTPVVMAVVRHLQNQGWHPGVVSRGYGRHSHDCRSVQADSHPDDVGDEPLLLAQTCNVPVAVAPQRIDAARHLRAHHPEINIIVCDDGLQHWALARDVEICVFNEDGIGNAWLLPAGPLREPWPRAVDLVVHAGPPPVSNAPTFALKRQLAPWAIRVDGTRVPLCTLQDQPLVAVAAIARPEHFFAMLATQGLQLNRTVALPDHFNFEGWQCPTPANQPLLCTEKDAIKLWRHHPEALAVPLQVEIAPEFFMALDAHLARTLSSRPSPCH
ncbi:MULTISPECIES: tetraacyldisaccharide 4'-kinase [Giesbergeria]|uniref:Tetraacyldisaccharide 4'-kinase n=1 Tax=Giesbergeria sinuosa TaxID=80883 RepID=A0ABV9QAM5_9BURK